MSLLNMEACVGVPVLETEDDMVAFLTETFLYETKERPPQPPSSPRALNHCMDGLLQQIRCCAVYDVPPLPLYPLLLLPPSPPQTHRHTRTWRSTASVFVLRESAAPWKPLLPPSRPQPLSHRILPTIHASPWDDRLSCSRRRGKREETKRRRDQQHAGYCRHDEEGVLVEQLEGPGY